MALVYVGAIAVAASIALVIVTILAVDAARKAADATEKAATATQRATKAAGREAAATEAMVGEMGVDRELNWRPYLSTQLTLAYDPPPTLMEPHRVKNSGRGPAINCRIAVRVGDTWKTNRYLVNLAPSAIEDVYLEAQTTQAPSEIFPETARGGAAPKREVVLICEDQFGNRLIHRPPKAQPEIWRPGSPDAGDKPHWVAWTEGPGALWI